MTESIITAARIALSRAGPPACTSLPDDVAGRTTGASPRPRVAGDPRADTRWQRLRRPRSAHPARSKGASGEVIADTNICGRYCDLRVVAILATSTDAAGRGATACHRWICSHLGRSRRGDDTRCTCRAVSSFALGRGQVLAPNLLPPARDQRTLARFDRLDQQTPAQAVSNIVDGRQVLRAAQPVWRVRPRPAQRKPDRSDCVGSRLPESGGSGRRPRCPHDTVPTSPGGW